MKKFSFALFIFAALGLAAYGAIMIKTSDNLSANSGQFQIAKDATGVQNF